MNYDKPRQLDGGPSAGQWHYTTRNDSHIHAIGYCSRVQVCPECQGYSYMRQAGCEGCTGQGYIMLDADIACPGHETEEGAREHYRAYLFDHKLDLGGTYGREQRPCEVCDAWTSRYATLGGTYMHTLCDLHRSRDTMLRLVPAIGDSIHS